MYCYSFTYQTELNVKIFINYVISAYISPWRRKNREARWTALQPINVIKGRVIAKRDCIDAMREDMAVVEVTEEDAEDRNKWRRKNSQLRPLIGEAERRSR